MHYAMADSFERAMRSLGGLENIANQFEIVGADGLAVIEPGLAGLLAARDLRKAPAVADEGRAFHAGRADIQDEEDMRVSGKAAGGTCI